MADRHEELRAALGPVGIWSFALQTLGAEAESHALAEYESMGYPATWIPESIGSKEVLSHAGLLLARGGRMVVATGIANIYARDPMAMAAGAATLADAYPGRFVLGIGVSHAPSVATRGSEYENPIARMRGYLDAMAAAEYIGPSPGRPAPVVLAALGPRMLELAAERADGAHSYFVPVEHTGIARERLGPGPVLAVEQTAIIEPDREASQRIARAFAARYLALENYANNLRRLGWSDEDVAGSGSDRLLDAVIVQGDAAMVAARVRAHLDAGADHVCVQLRGPDRGDLCLESYRELITALHEIGAT